MLFSDLETYSETPIKHGTHAYAERAEVLLWAYAIDDGPVECWDVTSGLPMPADLAAALSDPTVMTCWHNGGMFDSTILRHTMDIDLPPERIEDSMVVAMMHSLPGGLAQLCDIMQVPADEVKSPEGKRLIQLFCKPRPKSSKVHRATRETHPAEWATFIDYAKHDITAARSVWHRLPKWNNTPTERALWALDQRINQRGVCIDLPLVQGAIVAIEHAKKDLASRASALTEGQVPSATKRELVLNYVAEAYGVILSDLQGATIDRMLDDAELPAGLRELLQVRVSATTTSTAKYTTLHHGVSRDGRLRGTLQFCGAGRTGRWSGRLFQPQNLPRPSMKQADIDAGIDALKQGCAELVYPDIMKLTSSAIRGCIIAPCGRKLVVADLSNIEGRDQAWLAGEAWKLAAFQAYDTCRGLDGQWHSGAEIKRAQLAGHPIPLELDKKSEPVRQGHDLYKLAYAKSFGCEPEDVTKEQRQVGKVQELALGYQGGVSAFTTFAAVYHIDLETLPDLVFAAADDNLVRAAREFLDWNRKQKRSTHGLSDDAFVACDTLKRAWRAAHPNIEAMWAALDDAVRRAIDSTGKVFAVRSLRVTRTGNWLRIILPSGRSLCYPSPRIDADNKITYMGVNQYSRKWCRLSTYGGKLFENVCQAVARDIMAGNMPAIEDAGYAICLSVHDELITEADNTEAYTHGQLAALLAANPAWAQDIPLAAAGFESDRYKKD